MISIWVFLVGLSLPLLLGYDIAKVLNVWVNSKYNILIQKREEEGE